MSELYQNFLLAVGAGILMVFAVLVLLFVRVLQPITHLSALAAVLEQPACARHSARISLGWLRYRPAKIDLRDDTILRHPRRTAPGTDGENGASQGQRQRG